MEGEDQSLDILLSLIDEDEEVLTSSVPSGAQDSLQIHESLIKNDTPVPKYREISDPDCFLKARVEVPAVSADCLGSKSLVHAGDTDSSDDEDNRYAHEAKYDSYGKSIKHMLAIEKVSMPLKFSASKTSSLQNSKDTQKQGEKRISEVSLGQAPKITSSSKKDLYAEPISGIRIVNPTMPFQELREKMIGRQDVRMHSLKHSIEKGALGNDWFTIGVVVKTSPVKTSQKGNKYIIWSVSDLKGEMKTVTLMLFAGAFAAFSKTLPGTVIGVLNASVMNSRDDKKDDVTLSVDNAQKVLIVGKSKDFGFCKSKKKDGNACTMIVNKYVCDVCIYHAQVEYKKSSRRSELQSATGGHIALRNKVLGKSEVFYGGQSFAAIPAKRSKKQDKKDNLILKQLSGIHKINTPVKSDSSHPLLEQKCSAESKKFLPPAESVSSLSQVTSSKRISIFQQRLATSASTVVSTATCDPKESAFSLLAQLKASKEKDTSLAKSSTITDQHNSSSKSPVVKKTNPLANLAQKNTMKQKSVSKDRSYDAKAKSSVIKNRSISEKSMNVDKAPLEAKQEILNTFVPKLTEPSEEEFLSACLEFEEKHFNKKLTVQSMKESKFKKQVNKIPVSSNPKRQKSSATDAILPLSSHSTSKLNPDMSKEAPEKRSPTVFSSVDLNTVPTIEFSNSSIFGNSKRRDPKLKALKFVKQNGPIVKSDPNAIKKNATTDKVVALKRKFGFSPRDHAKPLKSPKTDSPSTSARFKKLLEATSRHQNLIEEANNEAQNEYFDKLEQKEKIEEKLLSTYSVPCKAVYCRQCNYTAFASSDLCKKENHRIKVIDAVKRFFKCHHCRDRTVCLTVVPVLNCKCGKSTWERAPMIAEKKTSLNSLSICGNNEKQYNPSEANLNLLVPE